MALRVIGVGFDHMHIGDQLQDAVDQPGAEVVGVYDDPAHPGRAAAVLTSLGLDVPVHDDLDRLIDETKPDIAVVCTTTSQHPEAVAVLLAAGVHALVEKPMADSNEAADAIMAAAAAGSALLAFNWPQAWQASHRTTHRLIAEGVIGRVQQVHSYGGNRGPLHHSHGKIELEPTAEQKAASWWYDPALGGGSLRDYLGYAATLGTWFRGGEAPEAVTAAWHIPDGLRVDEQSVVIGHYPGGLSVFETRWGTFTDPWTQQPLPHCGYVVNGTDGAIASWDYAEAVTVHDRDGIREVAVDPIPAEERSALANLIAHLATGRELDAIVGAEITRAGHAIVEAAVQSARTARRVDLR